MISLPSFLDLKAKTICSSGIDFLFNSQKETPLIEEGFISQEATLFAQDSSVDIHGNPTLKEKTRNWKACPFILGNECCERLAYDGIVGNLITYLTTKLHEETVSVSTNVTTWQGTCYLTPLIGVVHPPFVKILEFRSLHI